MNQSYRLTCSAGHEIRWDPLELSPIPFKCNQCKKSLFISSEISPGSRNMNQAFFSSPRSFWEYMECFVPEAICKEAIVLGEGNTPVLPSQPEEERRGKLFFKDESRNPTKSYRDRAASLLVAHAISLKKETICVASTGNMGAAISAYAARAGLITRVYSEKTIDFGKKSQILTYGGNLEEFDNMISVVKAMNSRVQEGAYQGTPELNPMTLLAQKTMAYEMVAGGIIPDEIFTSIGNGGTLFSIWQGFKDLLSIGCISRMPRIYGAIIMPGGAARINPLTESSELSQRDLAELAMKDSGGYVIKVSEEDIGNAISILARSEGLFVEPASAAAYAAFLKENEGTANQTRVIILTGTGLKTPAIIEALSSQNGQGMHLFHGRVNLRLHILEQIENAGPDGLHGYGIYLTIKDECSKQAIYMHLKNLEEKGFINSLGKDEQGRKLYRITENGREVLDLLKKLVSLL